MLSRSGESEEEIPCRAFDRPRRARETRCQKGWLLVGPSDRSTAPVWLRQDRHRNATPRSAGVHSLRRKPWPCVMERVSRKRARSPRSGQRAHESAPTPARAAGAHYVSAGSQLTRRGEERSVSILRASSKSAERKRPSSPSQSA